MEDWCLDALTGHSGAEPGLGGELSNLTVVVPSRERQDYLLRQIRYWSTSPASLVIVDGSSSPLPDRIRSAVEAYPRITYRHDPSSMADRLRLAGSLIESPYAVMLGDDEFHLPAGLGASVRVLDSDKKLVGCMGQVLSFSPVGPYRRIVFAHAYSSMHGYSIRHNLAADRLIAAMSDYTMATCYAVLRTPIWRRSWGSVAGYASGAAQELQQAMAVYLLGPFTTTNHVQWLRSIENLNEPVSPEEEGGKIWFPEWWESQRFAAERSRFTMTLATVVAGELAVSHDECSGWVTAGAQTYVDNHRKFFELLSKRSAPRLLPLVGRVLRAIARFLPDPLFLGAKRVRGSVLRALGRPGGSYYGTVDDLPRILASQGLLLTPEDEEELNAIEAMVGEFHSLRADKSQGGV